MPEPGVIEDSAHVALKLVHFRQRASGIGGEGQIVSIARVAQPAFLSKARQKRIGAQHCEISKHRACWGALWQAAFTAKRVEGDRACVRRRVLSRPTIKIDGAESSKFESQQFGKAKVGKDPRYRPFAYRMEEILYVDL